jgi:hypothetical protein
VDVSVSGNRGEQFWDIVDNARSGNGASQAFQFTIENRLRQWLRFEFGHLLFGSVAKERNGLGVTRYTMSTTAGRSRSAETFLTIALPAA